MRKFSNLLILLIGFGIVLLSGCSFAKDDAPEAKIPVITSITPDVTTLLNLEKELTVAVDVADEGVLTYQWYVAESKLSKGTAIENANSQSFIPPVTEVGTLYYYCIINNQLGNSSRSVISPLITFTVKENISAQSPIIIEQPTAQALEMGKNFILNVAAYSPDNGVLTYQWYFSAQGSSEEVVIENATESSYEGSVTKDTIGNYWCVVTSTIQDNGDGGVKIAQTKSNKVLVKNNIVNAANPIILKQPEKLTLNFDEKFALNVIAYSVDNGVLSYQWYKDEQVVEGATSAIYKGTVSSASLGEYYCEVTSTIADNGDGGVKSAKLKSETVTIESTTINAKKPVIQQMPMNVSAEYGILFSLTVIAHSPDEGKLSYQWYKDNQKIDGAIYSTYRGTVSSVTLGEYYCEVINTIEDNGDGGVKTAKEITSIAIISKNTVNANAPVINQNPDSVSSVFGESFTFSVAAYSVDNGTLTYQWYRNDSPIEGAISQVYTGRVSAETVGNYYCEVTNTITDNGDGGKKISKAKTEIKTLSYNVINAAKPEILLQPENVVTAFGNDFEFTVIAKASDNGTLSYKWFKIDEDGESQEISATGNKITGIMSDSFVGSYYCVITNTIDDNGDGGKKSDSVTTNSVLLAKNMINALTPVITNQPVDSIMYVPAIKVLFAGASVFDDGTLSYQWYSVLEGEDEGVAIEGATEARYKIYAGEEYKSGYYCVVTNTLADNGDGGVKTASVRSYTAWIEAVSMEDVVSAPDFTVQPVAMNIAPYNQSISLSCEAESGEGIVFYRWYQSTDGTTATGEPVSGATSSVFDTPVYTERGIYYYYCVATNVFNDVKSAAVISDVVSVAYTGLPTLYLNTEIPTAEITKEDYVFGNFKLITEDFGTTEYTFKKEKNGEKKEGIKGRGNTSWSMPKKGYSIKFDSKQSFFGLPKAKKWCIIANYPDKTLLRNKFASIMGNEIFNSEWNPSFVSLDVIMNGEYRGNYIFCERNTLSEGRIDVQDISDVEEKLAEGKESKIDDANGDGVKDLKDGGFLIEVEANETRAKDNDFYFRGTKGGRLFCLKDPDEVSSEIQNQVQSVILNAENVLYSSDFEDLESGWRKYIDEDSVIDWYLINELAKNNDSIFFSSVYMYYNPVDEKLHLGPIWDFDISCGNVNYNDCDNPSDFWVKKSIWISRMFDDVVFVSNLKERWNDRKSDLYMFINTELQELSMDNTVSAEYNFEKWTILGTYVWPNAAGYKNRTTYQSEIQYLLDWLNNRYDWLDSAINEL